MGSQPALKVALLATLGILLDKLLGLPIEVMVSGMMTLFLLAVVTVWAFRFGQDYLTRAIIAALLVISLGATKHSADSSPLPFISDTLINKQIVLSGVVTSDPTVIERRQQFTLACDRIFTSEEILPARMNVLIRFSQVRQDSVSPAFRYGMTIGVRGIVERPSEQRNPGDFNARQYYEANGISYLMRVKGNVNVVVFDSAGGTWFMRSLVMPARRYILHWIDRTTGGDEGEFLKGILIGEKSNISRTLRDAFTNSGTAHVLAVSGSNVAVVAVFVLFLFELLRLKRSVRIVGTVLVLILYMLLTGSQPPVVRATIMAAVFLLAGLFQEKSQPLNALGVAAIIILAIDARQVFDIGFQLSFAAVLSIVLMYPRTNVWINLIPGRNFGINGFRWLLRAAALSLVASLGTLPFTAIYFGKVSVIGIAANAVVVPAVGGSVVLGLVSILAGLLNTWIGEAYAALNWLLLWLTINVAVFSGGLSIAYLDTFQFRWVHALPFYLALTLVFSLSSQKAIRLLVPALLISLHLVLFSPASGLELQNQRLMRVSMIDVGQGDAIFIQLPGGKNLLVDAGPWSPDFDTGERIVVPFLKRLGISEIDFLIASHAHNDHIGGFKAVFDQMRVKRVIDSGQPQSSQFYRNYVTALHNEGSVHEGIRSGTLLYDQDEVRLYVLYPTKTFITADSLGHHPNLNNTSVVFKLCYGGISFLFTGDAEEEAEAELVHVYGDFLRSTVLKVGHHGSITSSSDVFLDAVQPTVAIISVGRNNKFNHPSPIVIERLQTRGSGILRTDEDGAVMIETDGHTWRQVEWK